MVDSQACRPSTTSSLALAAHDLGVHLIGTCVEQLDGLILEGPDVAVVSQVSFISLYSLTWHQFGRFNS
jgi:hypothetical protein